MNNSRTVHIFIINTVWHLFIAQLMVAKARNNDVYYLCIVEKKKLVERLVKNPILIRHLWNRVDCFSNEEVVGGFELKNIFKFKKKSLEFYDKYLLSYGLDKESQIQCFIFNDVINPTRFLLNQITYRHSVTLNLVDEGFNSYLPHSHKKNLSAWYITFLNKVKSNLVGSNSPENVFSNSEYTPNKIWMIFDDIYSELYLEKDNIYSLKKHINRENINLFYQESILINLIEYRNDLPILLYLTQPLYFDGLILEQKEISVAEELKLFCLNHDLHLVIKPHPRESIEYLDKYKRLQEKNICTVIEEYQLPVEILVSAIKPKISCGFFSTSLYNISLISGCKSYSFLPLLEGITSDKWKKKYCKIKQVNHFFNAYIEVIKNTEMIKL